MRRITTLWLAIILGLTAALNTNALLAQEAMSCEQAEEVSGFPLDCDSDFAEGLVVTAEPEPGIPYRFYDVQFEDEEEGAGAYIPERFNTDAMVVEVLQGFFAFRVQGPGVIVTPENGALEKYIADIAIGLGENPNEDGVDPTAEGIRRTYTLAPVEENFACDVVLADGRTACLLKEADFLLGDTFVRLEPGDTVYLPSNSTCFICNTSRLNADGSEDPTSDIPAELLIWSSTTGFNGELEFAASGNLGQATPSAQGSGRILSWMFNPGGRCN